MADSVCNPIETLFMGRLPFRTTRLRGRSLAVMSWKGRGSLAKECDDMGLIL